MKVEEDPDRVEKEVMIWLSRKALVVSLPAVVRARRDPRSPGVT
jgi:hypothetical protein